MNMLKIIDKNIKVRYSKAEKPISDSIIEIYDTYKISVLLTDGLAAIVGDRVMSGEKYDIFFFRPDEIHFGRFLRSGTHEYLDFYIPTDFFNDFSDKNALAFFLEDRQEGRINIIKPDGRTRKIVSELSEKVLSCLENEGEFCNTELFSVTLQIVLLCAALYKNQKNDSVITLPPVVSRTLSYIDLHFAEKITVNGIAHIMGCSETYLSRMFKIHTGVSVHKHITDVRISNAQKMLSLGASVTEACYSCGFDDCSNFIKTFKRSTGETPLKYKKRFY